MFERLEPPRGGLAFLRERITRDRRRRRLWRTFAGLAAACLIVFVLVQRQQTPDLEKALALATTDRLDSPARLQLVARHDGVAFYWAATK